MSPGTVPGRRRLSVVVPVYGNEGSLPSLFAELRRLEGALDARDMDLELIFVDDGSPDRALAVLREFRQERPATRVVKLTRNFGAVRASKTGMRFVTGDCFLILAADLQDPPALILDMVDRWRAGAKYVLCVRQARQDSRGSRVAAGIFYWLLRRLVVPDYPRGGYDLALMDRAFLPHMIDSAKNVNTPVYAFWLGFRPEIIPYTRAARRHGRSRWTLAKRVTFGLDALLGLSVVPIRAMSVVGALVAAISMGYGTLIGVNALRGIRPVPGFATVTVILSFLLGLVLVMLGVIGEYLWRIYDEVSRKAEVVIEEIW